MPFFSTCQLLLSPTMLVSVVTRWLIHHKVCFRGFDLTVLKMMWLIYSMLPFYSLAEDNINHLF